MSLRKCQHLNPKEAYSQWNILKIYSRTEYINSKSFKIVLFSQSSTFFKCPDISTTVLIFLHSTMFCDLTSDLDLQVCCNNGHDNKCWMINWPLAFSAAWLRPTGKTRQEQQLFWSTLQSLLFKRTTHWLWKLHAFIKSLNKYICLFNSGFQWTLKTEQQVHI